MAHKQQSASRGKAGNVGANARAHGQSLSKGGKGGRGAGKKDARGAGGRKDTRDFNSRKQQQGDFPKRKDVRGVGDNHKQQGVLSESKNIGGAISRKQQSDLLEGRNALAEALCAGVPIENIWASAPALDDKRISAMLERARRAGAKILQASGAQLDNMSLRGSHQGIVASIKAYKYASLQDLVDAASDKKNALVIVCDHITDVGNFGAICRSAEVVGATGVLIPNKRSARVNASAYKTSAGAVAHLPIAMEANLARSLEKLKENGFWVVGASEHSKQVFWDANMQGRIALVMGSEDKGMSRLVLETCDLVLALPQAGKIESLNVAQACTALSYEWMRQCR